MSSSEEEQSSRKAAADAKNLSKLRLERGVPTMQQTKMKTYAEQRARDACIPELETKLQLLESYFATFNRVQAAIERLDEGEVDSDKRDQYEESYCTIKTKSLTYIQRGTRKLSEATLGNQSTSEGTQRRSVHLPNIQLPKFSGEATNWLDFINLFEKMVDGNNDLDDIEKFHHLRSCLTGNAAKTESCLELTAKNYKEALAALRERYEDKSFIVRSHIAELFGLPSVGKKSNQQLRDVLDSANCHIRALLTIETKEQLAESLLLHLIASKMDIETQSKWQECSTTAKIPTCDEFRQFLESRCRSLAIISVDVSQRQLPNVSQRQTAKQPNQNKVHTSTTFISTAAVSDVSKRCIICKDTSHSVFKCQDWMKLTPVQRFNEAKTRNLCINCLSSDHSIRQCKAGKCQICKKSHHTLLHFESHPNEKDPKADQNQAPALIAANTNSTSTFHISDRASHQGSILATALIDVEDHTGALFTCRAILDSGSQMNFVSEHCSQLLKLKRTKVNVLVNGIGETDSLVHHSVQLSFQSRQSNFRTTIEALVLRKVTAVQPNNKIDTQDWNIPNNIVLADPTFHMPQHVDILIGATLFFELLAVGQIKVGNNLPTIQKTLLEWIVAGPTGTSSCVTVAVNTCIQSNEESDDRLNQLVQLFWNSENYGAETTSLSEEEERCEQHFIQNTRRLSDGRYAVRLPFLKSTDIIGESFEIALKRFLVLEKKLCKLPTLKKQYTEFMGEYLVLNHMEPFDVATHSKAVRYFMPHHGVLKDDSSSTRLRVVFDASCKSSSGQSLNDLLMAGPTIQPDLFSLLIRFRTYRYVVTADIVKIYRQVAMQEDDRNWQCIIWRNNPDDDLQGYRMTTVTYGTKSAPFLAIRTLQQLAMDEAERYPLGSKVVTRDFYVDNLMSGSNSLQQLSNIIHQTTALLERGQLPLRKWCSNNLEAIRHIPSEDREPLMYINNNEVVKALGLIWNPNQDSFMFLHQTSDNESRRPFTKRRILAEIARIFDPLGIINPIVVKGKILLQNLWKLNIHWDETLPQQLETQWQQYHQQIIGINELRIPRHVISPNSVIEIHGFADASEKAYGACIYCRSIGSQGPAQVQLLCGKSRVAPLKNISLPRLELNAALVLSELLQHTLPALDFPIKQVYCWSDSTIVLTWISEPSYKWTTFEANRVAKIQHLTKGYIWNHVRSENNPADLISRGVYPEELVSSTLWFNGPHLLRECSDQSLKSPTFTKVESPAEERKQCLMLVATETTTLLDNHKYSNSFSRLHRRSSRHLTIRELEQGGKAIVKILQQQFFKAEFSALASQKELPGRSTLKGLNPFIDNEGLIRVGGRLKHSQLQHDAKHPMVLPKSHPVIDALFNHFHKIMLHAGCLALLNSIRQHYWPIGGRSTARKIVHKCVQCFRCRRSPANQLMGELPPERVQHRELRPFITTGIDFCGPMYITTRIRGKAAIKVYVAIFICFATKAVHLELVSELTTEAFILALKRFIGRRGKCSVLYSDNATNFVGAKSQLGELRRLFYSQQHQDDVIIACQENGIQCKFIPPRSPHFGGLWEAAVKTAKFHMHRIIGTSLITYEELNTIIIQIEAVMNSRPISPLSADPNDLQALTPGHYIIGAPLTSIIEPQIKEENINRLNRYNRLRALYQHFWNRWSSDYLNTLQNRTKWKDESNNVTVNTLVLIKDTNLPPLKWQLGRIIEFHPGSDGLVRAVTVKTATGAFKRSVVNVCPLPVET